MSGDIASRYIGGVPYGPGRSIGRYPNAASVGAAPGVVNFPTVQGRPVDTSGQVRAVSTPLTGGSGASGVGGNLLASLLMAGLSSAPDIVKAADRLLADDAPAVAEPGSFDQGTFAGPGGVQIPNAALGGLGTNWDNVFEPGSWSVDQAGTQALLDAPMPPGDQFAGLAGDGAAAFADGAAPGALGAIDDPLYGAFGETPILGGDLATGLAGLGGGSLGGLITAQMPWTRQGYGSIGQQAGSAIGGIGAGAAIGSAFGPIGTFFGALGGALLGGTAGGAAGSQMGPLPTIGRNFSSFGQFDPSGGINWTTAGGDNGADATDASGFANWFEPALAREASAQGLTFNPAMAGQQFRVGAYDNFSRSGPSPAGGYFYTPDTAGGSPENYALRPSDDWAQNGYSPEQAAAFTRNVLADLTARGAYTQAGQEARPGDYWGSSQGAPLGWYGAPGGDYTTIQSGGSDFSHLLADRQGEITGWINNAPWRAYESAVAQMPGLPQEGENAPAPGPTPYWNGSALAWAPAAAPVALPYEPGGA